MRLHLAGGNRRRTGPAHWARHPPGRVSNAILSSPQTCAWVLHRLLRAVRREVAVHTAKEDKAAAGEIQVRMDWWSQAVHTSLANTLHGVQRMTAWHGRCNTDQSESKPPSRTELGLGVVIDMSGFGSSAGHCNIDFLVPTFQRRRHCQPVVHLGLLLMPWSSVSVCAPQAQLRQAAEEKPPNVAHVLQLVQRARELIRFSGQRQGDDPARWSAAVALIKRMASGTTTAATCP